MATIVPSNSNLDALGTPAKPWATVATKTLRLPSQANVLDTAEKLYSSNGQLFFDGSPLLTEAQVLGTTEWISEEVVVDAPINADGHNIVLDNEIKQVNNNYQVRVLLNGLELAENEFVVADDNKTITLDLPGQVYPIEVGETFKVWYVKA